MPKIITELPAANRGTRSSKYPWEEWFDGQAREFEQGEDFSSTIRSFTGLAYGKARAMGKSLVIRKVSETVVAMQATDVGARRGAGPAEPAPRGRRKPADAE